MLETGQFYLIDGAALAFVAGLLSSPHCVGMCGPLGCSAFFSCSKGSHSAQVTTAVYHVTRAMAYALVGACMGLLGSYPFKLLSSQPAHFLVVGLTLFFVILLLRSFPAVANRWKLFYLKSLQRVKGMPNGLPGVLLGLFTPLLPCGPLYLMFFVCAASGSMVKGAEIGLGFALGTIPLLWLAQSQYLRFFPKFKTSHARWIHQGVTVCATGVILWRMTQGDGALGTFFCHTP